MIKREFNGKFTYENFQKGYDLCKELGNSDKIDIQTSSTVIFEFASALSIFEDYIAKGANKLKISVEEYKALLINNDPKVLLKFKNATIKCSSSVDNNEIKFINKKAIVTFYCQFEEK